MKKSLDVIDLLKFIASIMIFTMHSNLLGLHENACFVFELLSRWGVPFFFICSSFFLFRKGVSSTGSSNGKSLSQNVADLNALPDYPAHSADDHAQHAPTRTYIHMYIKRIATLTLVWFIINLPSVLYGFFYGKSVTSFSTWLTLIRKTLFGSAFTGSWYLMSSMFSALFVFLLCRKLRTGTVAIVSLIPYLLCVFSAVYEGLLPEGVYKVTHFLCFPLNVFNGCFCFALGKYLAENTERVTRVFTKTRSAILFIASYCVYGAEILIAKRLDIYGCSDVAFSTAAIAFFLVVFCLQLNLRIKHAKTLRKISTIVYCCQANVLLFNSFCRKAIGLPYEFAYLLSAFCIVGICVLIMLAQKKMSWKWVQYLT